MAASAVRTPTTPVLGVSSTKSSSPLQAVEGSGASEWEAERERDCSRGVELALMLRLTLSHSSGEPCELPEPGVTSAAACGTRVDTLDTTQAGAPPPLLQSREGEAELGERRAGDRAAGDGKRGEEAAGEGSIVMTARTPLVCSGGK